MLSLAAPINCATSNAVKPRFFSGFVIWIFSHAQLYDTVMRNYL
jgi:hypothetical protein